MVHSTRCSCRCQRAACAWEWGDDAADRQGLVGLRAADRVMDGCGLIPPKGGHYHGPRQSAGRAEGTAVAAMDRPVANERVERAGLLWPPRPGNRQLLPLVAGAGAARDG